MCGINLIVDKNKRLTDATQITRMNAATAHRGPDFSRHHTLERPEARLFFGHNQLRVMDNSAKLPKQPLFSKCGRYVLIYNGEIYNFQALKSQLPGKKYCFDSQADTEVLLSLLIEKGKDAVKEMNGMFAFAFYDMHQGRLLLARDPSGMKPLYYTENEHYLIFSSEIRGIIASGLVEKQPEKAQIHYYLRFGFANKPYTFFRNIFELCEGCLFEKDKSGESKIYSPENTKYLSAGRIDKKNLIENTELYLQKAVQRHLVAEAPIGIFLSGGVDSTLLLALIDSFKTRKIPSFSIVNTKKQAGFGTKDYYYANLAARQYGSSNHHEVVVDSLIMNLLDEWVDAIDQPVADSAALLSFYLCKIAKDEVKVVLSGAGADELFAGYNRHYAYHKYLKNQQFFKGTLPLLKVIAAALPTMQNHPFRKKFQLIKKFTRGIADTPFMTFINFTSLQYGLPADYEQDEYKKIPVEACFDQALTYDKHHYLISDILAINDKISMYHSLEMRMPYLDKELTSFITSIPAEWRIRYGKKWILKKILAKYGGKRYTKRQKEGFGFPLANWLVGDPKIAWELENKYQLLHTFVDINLIKYLLARHKTKKEDYSREIWAIFVLGKWLQHNFS